MLDSLTQRLTKVVKTIRGQARLTESNMQDMLREIRIALLEADVAIPVVKDLIARIKEKALGTEVQTSLTPGQALVGIVHDELTKVIGGEDPENVREINLATQPPAIILLAGLQGAGKTTTAGKLGKWLKEEKKKKVLTVSADVYRPAAIDQLQTVSQQANIDFFPSTPNEKPLDIARKALEYAKLHYYDVLIVDTAGRLAIDEQMMNEVSDLEKFINPIETFFVVDAMVGQDAVNTAKAFRRKLPLTGVILTKVDGLTPEVVQRFPFAWSPVSPSNLWALVKNSTVSSVLIRRPWPDESSAWATSFLLSMKSARTWISKKPRSSLKKCVRATISHSKTSRISSLRSKTWAVSLP